MYKQAAPAAGIGHMRKDSIGACVRKHRQHQPPAWAHAKPRTLSGAQHRRVP